MGEAENTVLLIGLGDYESALLSRITETRKAIVMDIDESHLELYRETFPQIETIRGDASSMLTLRKVDFSKVSFIICSIRDMEVVHEICHILRDNLKVDLPILVIHYDPIETETFPESNLTFFNPIEAGSQAILNRMDTHIIRPTSIGKGGGELIQVAVKSASHLTARPLKYLRPTNWHVSMVYRDDEPLVPNGELKLRVGDRVILAGKPKVVENIAKLLITGTPQFPLQYGGVLLYPLEGKRDSILIEAAFWLQKTRLQKVRYVPYHHMGPEESTGSEFEYVPGIGLFRDLFDIHQDVGLLFVELKTVFRNARLRACFKYSKTPFLVSRNCGHYSRIVVSLNTDQPAVALETGFEISRMTDLPLEVTYVALPEAMQYEKDKVQIEERLSLVKDFKSIFKKEFTYHFLEGNPVRETLQILNEDEKKLLVVVSDHTEPTGFFNRNVPYLLSKKTKSSVLVIPGDITDDRL